MERGKFIVIEALDGAGKTTQVHFLSNELMDLGFLNHTTKECTDLPIGKLLKSDYLSGKQQCSIDVINILMAADRLQHVTDAAMGLVPRLERGTNFICDRYILSALAYDNYKLVDDYENWLIGFYHTLEMNRRSLELLVPDIILFLDVDPETCFARIKSRKGSREVYEDLDRLVKIRMSYLYAIDEFNRLYGDRCKIITYNNNDADALTVTDELMDILQKELKI